MTGNLERLTVLLPVELKMQIGNAARIAGRSVNDEMVSRLEALFHKPEDSVAMGAQRHVSPIAPDTRAIMKADIPTPRVAP